MQALESSLMRSTCVLCAVVLIGTLASCGKKSAPSMPPVPLDFPLALQYAQRANLAYEQDATIQRQSGADVKITIVDEPT